MAYFGRVERTIDSTDLRIMEILQADARTANAEIARRLTLAPSAIHQRVRKLEERGVIQSYAARIEPKSVKRGLLAFIHLQTDERLGDQTVAEDVARLSGVLEVHDIAGEDCYLLKVRVEDTEDLHRLLRDDLAAIPGVRGTRTTIVLKTICERAALPLPGCLENGTN